MRFAVEANRAILWTVTLIHVQLITGIPVILVVAPKSVVVELKREMSTVN